MQTILVTWWCWFIWSNFLNRYISRYPEIQWINLDAMTYAGKQENLDDAVKQSDNYTFVQCDIRDMNALREVYTNNKITDCIHFAAESHVDNSIKNPALFLETNVLGTANLLNLHRDFWCQRFHYISTDEVYGDLPLDHPELKFTDTTPLHPHSPYSTSKAGGDMLVQAYGTTYGLDYTISRCSNNYGPHQDYEKLIPRSLSLLLHNKPIQLYGKGENIRDRIHVDDHNNGVWMIFTKASSGSIYNLGWNSEKTNNEIAHLLCTLTNKNPNEYIEYITDRAWHDRRYAIDYTKTTHELWWEPIIKFEEGIQQTINRYINHS
jgi:dTDP-glucose 4,6-dehydratase